MSGYFTKKTEPLQHKIVKLISPGKYKDAADLEARLYVSPRPMAFAVHRYFLEGHSISIVDCDGESSKQGF